MWDLLSQDLTAPHHTVLVHTLLTPRLDRRTQRAYRPSPSAAKKGQIGLR